MMSNEWRIFDKKSEDLIYDLFELPGPIFNTPLKVAQIDIYAKINANPVAIFLENDQRPDPNFGSKEAHELSH